MRQLLPMSSCLRRQRSARTGGGLLVTGKGLPLHACASPQPCGWNKNDLGKGAEEEGGREEQMKKKQSLHSSAARSASFSSPRAHARAAADGAER